MACDEDVEPEEEDDDDDEEEVVDTVTFVVPVWNDAELAIAGSLDSPIVRSVGAEVDGTISVSIGKVEEAGDVVAAVDEDDDDDEVEEEEEAGDEVSEATATV